MAFNNNVQMITGKAYWAKVLGNPVPAYDPEEKHWTIDVVPDAGSVSFLQQQGLGGKIKDDVKNSHDGQRFVNFTRREFKRGTTTKNQPINVEDKDGEEWDQKVLIGNGSLVEVKFNSYDVPARGRFPASKGVAILDVKILELIEYVKPDVKKTPAKKKVDSSVESWSGDIV